MNIYRNSAYEHQRGTYFSPQKPTSVCGDDDTAELQIAREESFMSFASPTIKPCPVNYQKLPCTWEVEATTLASSNQSKNTA